MDMARQKSNNGSRKGVFLVVLAMVLLVVGIFGYNKYLDWRNVEDMQQLLTS